MKWLEVVSKTRWNQTCERRKVNLSSLLIQVVSIVTNIWFSDAWSFSFCLKRKVHVLEEAYKSPSLYLMAMFLKSCTNLPLISQIPSPWIHCIISELYLHCWLVCNWSMEATSTLALSLPWDQPCMLFTYTWPTSGPARVKEILSS